MDWDMLRERERLDAEAGLAPVPPLSVVADGVACPQTNPLRDRAVLLLRLGELLLRAERLVARHFDGCFVKYRERSRFLVFFFLVCEGSRRRMGYFWGLVR